MIKILHGADFHYDREHQEAALTSLRVFSEVGEREGVDLFVIAGDLFNRGVQNSENSGLPELQRIIQGMMNIAPVVAVSGTPTHDIPGCYRVFEKTTAEYSFTLLNPHEQYFLSDGFLDVDPINPSLLIIGCPEPQRGWFVANSNATGRAETTEAIQNGMREMLLGWAALRKQYPNIPCLFVYHGYISGSSTCNGHSLPLGDIQIGRDDLRLVGADYYALGHVHLTQKIGDLKAYYAGSAYPVDWGETDQKTFKLVHFYFDHADNPDNDNAIDPVEVECINYPHPPRKKIVTDAVSSISASDVKGYQTWVEIKDFKERLAEVTYDEEALISQGALPGSRVTHTAIPVETVRAGEIQEAKRLRDKVVIWSENSDKEVSESILEKADRLEQEAREEGLTTDGLHIRINKLKLRGAIGIWKGQGKEEYSIDLDSLGPGLVALVGSNGAGKTTLIENMHPFPELLTRSGALANHFYLKDSYRDLYFTDERTGIQYRSLIQIDPTLSTPKGDYSLFRKNGEGYEPIVDRLKKEYEENIRHLFGSLTLYLRSAFASQRATRNHPDINDAPPGQQKELFGELGGLGYLDTYSDQSKEKAREIDMQVLGIKGQIEGLENVVDDLPSKESEKKTLAYNLVTIKEQLEDHAKRGKELKTELNELTEQMKEQEKIGNEIARLSIQHEKLGDEEHELANSITGYQHSIMHRPKAEKELAEYEELKKREEELNAEQTRILRERERLLSEHSAKEKDFQDARRECEENRRKVEKNLQEIAKERIKLDDKLSNLQKELEKPLEKNCPKCAQLLPKDTLQQLHKERDTIREEIDNIEDQISLNECDVSSCCELLKKIENDLTALVPPLKPNLPEFDSTELEEVQGKLMFTNHEVLKQIIDDAKEAQIRIDEGNKQLSLIRRQIADNETQADTLNGQIKPEVNRKYSEISRADEKLRLDYADVRDRETELDVRIQETEKQILDLKRKVKELAELRTAMKTAQKEQREWEYLQLACGKKGIQALELDAMGPGIAEVANRLLNAGYGPRFQIRFETVKPTGKGSNRKQSEDFIIMVNDTQKGTEQRFETLSGGETVWVKQAIYDAFGIIRERNTGTSFKTVFKDESDSALDPGARQKYVAMLEAAHNESGRHQTILITHSQEAQEAIAQKIELARP
nr:hypothetical protein 12 [bacterium]